jgi:hypothetical protein
MRRQGLSEPLWKAYRIGVIDYFHLASEKVEAQKG